MRPLTLLALTLLSLLALAALAPRFLTIHHHRRDRGSAAIGALKTIATAQVLYREADKDGDGVLAYAPSLGALIKLGPRGDQDLIDEVLASGTKQGYVFAITSASEFGFTASADPAIPGTTGERYFGVNQRGDIYFSTKAPIRFAPDGSSSADPIGR